MSYRKNNIELSLKNKAKTAAERVLANHDVDDYPVPVEEIVTAKGVEISMENIISHGLMRREGDDYSIIINENTSHNRKRFTLAHEFGHVLLERGELLDSRKSGENSLFSEGQIEKVCHSFASFLLVPDESIDEISSWSKISINNLLEETDRLQVSLGTLVYRVLENAPEDGGFLWFKKENRPKNSLKNGLEDHLTFNLEWGCFPTKEKHPKLKGDSKFVIRYDSDLYRPLIKTYHDGREKAFSGVSINLSIFDKSPVKTTIITKRHGERLLWIIIPPSVDNDNIPTTKITKIDDYTVKELSDFG